jgi:hypothetical protein
MENKYLDYNRLYKVVDYVIDKYPELNRDSFEEGSLFIYYPEERIIQISNVIDEIEFEGNKFLEKYLYEEFNLYIQQEKMFIFSILHEIGHYFTFDMNNFDNYCNMLKGIEDDDYSSYRKIPEEYKADKWAVEFIKNNKNILLI